jgi:WD40 repeat protein
MWLKRVLAILGYTLVVAGLAIGTFALVAYGNDYSYDFKTGKIIQNGHVIINSVPNGIRVEADGKLLKKKTPYQAAYKVGEHTFALMKDGFWPWNKTLKVVAGQVNLVRYVIMVPKSPKTTVLDTRASIIAQSISKDHRHIAYVTGGTDAGLYTLDVGSTKPVKIFAAPLATETTPAEVLTEVTWSDDASHLLVVSTANGVPVHRLLAANGNDEPVNLTARYGFNFSGIRFSASNWRLLYWVSPDGLRRLDVGNQTISGVLAPRVQQFWVEQDRVLYVQQTALGKSLWSIDNGGRTEELIQVLPESDAYSVAFARYRGEDQLAVVPAKTGTGTLYTGVFGDTPEAKTIAQGVTTASFSPDGQFLAMTAANKLVTYDLEQSFIFKKSVSYTVTDHPGKLVALSWFDNHHILANRDGKLYWSEFDGTNLVELGQAYGPFAGYGTADDRSVVTYRPDGGSGVRITQLLIKQ